jgi:ribosomal protein L12E/L44/L45/RPP1/RPP2
MKVGVRSAGRSVAVLSALVAVFVLSLAGVAGAELIKPHASAPETVTPHAVTSAPQSEPAPEPEEEAESEESSEAEPEFKVHRHEIFQKPPPPPGTPLTPDPRSKRFDPPTSGLIDQGTQPNDLKDDSGRFTPWADAPWRNQSCDASCKDMWVTWADGVRVPRGNPSDLRHGLEEVIEDTLEKIEKAYIKADIKSLDQAPAAPASAPSNDPSTQSKGDQGQAVDDENPLETHDGSGKEQCRGQGNASDTNEKVEDGGSGTNVCR